MKITIEKPGRTKNELVKTLYNLKEDFIEEIDDDDVKIRETGDGLSFNVKKFIFYVEGKITVKNNLFEISYDTNAPDFKVKPVISKLQNLLRQC